MNYCANFAKCTYSSEGCTTAAAIAGTRLVRARDRTSSSGVGRPHTRSVRSRRARTPAYKTFGRSAARVQSTPERTRGTSRYTCYQWNTQARARRTHHIIAATTLLFFRRFYFHVVVIANINDYRRTIVLSHHIHYNPVGRWIIEDDGRSSRDTFSRFPPTTGRRAFSPFSLRQSFFHRRNAQPRAVNLATRIK